MQKSKYLLANDRDLLWGLTVSTIGREEILPGDPYPTRGHADGYYFNIEKGRILNEYQLLYNPEGEGIFESAHCKKTIIKPGDMFLLFPGEWHTYHPNPHTGWKSYWIGFKGRNMDDRVKAGFLSPEKPIYHIGYSSDIEHLYRTAYEVAIEEAAYSQQAMAGIVNHLIGLMYSLERNMELSKNQQQVDMISKARLMIRESLESDLTIQHIAEDLGVSYSNFRKLFKEYTGLSPATYQQELRLLRAKEMLTTTDYSIKEIAYRLNFESPDYFSAKFKAKMGFKPSEIKMK
ncbi:MULTISPECIES: AraC family transcriptional regulator [unclassified Prevotella]|jgi:AraC-like DNA-binding protein|uniref:AraC family transcriptional regulator n=1 Tax=unclassified Prevotella TaxID=2638335 RepID=UPI00056A8C75|nr:MULTISPECIES: AraC family transcriptional regulator [unclassified Prevotella]MCR5470323.1 AraC family transcriptional regulator [Prevotella sp.]SEW24434.1 AraC-type DNA-binding protein [Prevotella sp. khp7]